MTTDTVAGVALFQGDREPMTVVNRSTAEASS
jgi:hypothetical protein